jgi:hypothetical protein
MQCELSALEKDLKEVEEKDSKSDNENQNLYAKDAWTLLNATADRDGDSKQRTLINKIYMRLDDYSKW